MITLLKTLVGSQAHGLATPESDFDWRSVFITPTEEILKLGGNTKQTSWIEGKEDDTAWEIAHFLNMATHCNPTILEVFLAPVAQTSYQVGTDVARFRDLFPHVWNSKGVMDAFIGYGLNQRKKFLDEKDGRPNKFAAAYCRSLYNGWELLTKNTFTVRIADLPIGETIRRFKNGDYKVGEVIEVCYDLEKQVREAYKQNPDKKTNMEPVNEFLLEMRKKHWTE